jgi:hypothetical protein
MMQREPSMHRLNATDLHLLTNFFPNATRGSLVTLASHFGTSQSELHQWLDGAEHQLFADFVSGWMLEVVEVDLFRSTLRFHLHGAGEVCTVRELLNHCLQRTKTSKAYCYLFSTELQEQECLKAIGFELETIFRQHVYVGGRYLDLLVYGRIEATR